MIKKCNIYPNSLQEDNIAIDLQEKIILVTPYPNFTNKAISLFNNQVANISADALKIIEEIHIDLRLVQELPFFFIGSILSIFSQMKLAKIKIKNAPLSIINALNDYRLDKIFTTNS